MLSVSPTAPSPNVMFDAATALFPQTGTDPLAPLAVATRYHAGRAFYIGRKPHAVAVDLDSFCLIPHMRAPFSVPCSDESWLGQLCATCCNSTGSIRLMYNAVT